MMKNFFKNIIMFVILATLVFSTVNAYDAEDDQNLGDSLDLRVTQVKINGDVIETDEIYRTLFERGDDLEVKVELIADGDVENIEVEATLRGDEYNRVSETTNVFDMDANERKVTTLDLNLPNNMDQDHYSLRVFVTDRVGQSKVYNYDIELETSRHGMEIRDVILSPQEEVKAGNGVFANVRLKNTGLKDEEGVKVMLEIPELKLADSIYVDEIEAEDQVTTEELWPGRVPACTKEGIYDVFITVEYNEGNDIVTTSEEIKVIEGDFCGTPSEDYTNEEIRVPTTTQDITPGLSGAVYAIVIENPTASDKTYTVTVTGVEGWGVTRVDPENVVTVESGKSKAISVYVAADNDATAGNKPFIVKVESNTASAEAYLTANVVDNGQVIVDNNDDNEEQTTTGLKSGLQIALIVLVVLLFILALIIGFNKMKGNEDDDETETYY